VDKLVIGIIITIGIIATGILYIIFAEEKADSSVIKDDPFMTGIVEEITWVEIDPIQCAGNPWEQDWLESHPDDFTIFARPFLDKEVDIIKNYYKKLGIVIFDVKAVFWEDVVVCESCSCPAGYTLYLLVSESDLNKMLDQGFKVAQNQTR